MWRIFLQLHHFVRMFHFALAQAISCQNRVWHQCQFERTSHVNGALFKYGMHPHPFVGSKLWREGVNISPHVLGCDVFLKIQYWAYLVFLNAPPQSSTVCATNAISTSKCGQTPTLSMIRASSMLRSQRIGKGQKHTHTTQNTEADTGHFKGFCGSFFLCELPSTTSLPQSDIFSDAL